MSSDAADAKGHAFSIERLALHQNGLGDLFAYLWLQVEPHLDALHSVPWAGVTASEYKAIVYVLCTSSTAAVPAAVLDYLRGGTSPFKTTVPESEKAQRAFVVMRAIDELARAIHPTTVASTGLGRPAAPAPAVSAMRQRRHIFDDYGGGVDGTPRVVPKGPINDRLVLEDDASGDRLETQFGSLAVFRPAHGHYKVEIEVVSPKRFAAAPDPFDAGQPKIGIAPVAEDGADLAFSAVMRDSKPFLDARPAGRHIAERAASVVSALVANAADILVLPELCVDEDATDTILQALAAGPAPLGPRLIVLGSGPRGRCPQTGLPYNECIIADASGKELWRQRKLNHFRMSLDRMTECDMPRSCDAPHAENVATGTVLKVCDLPRFGRVVVLICEDLEQRLPAADAIADLRPDWIITPVLDVSQAIGRWTHARAVELGRTSGSKVVIANSATLSVCRAGVALLDQVAPELVGIGLFVDPVRRVRLVTMQDCATSPAHASIVWNPSAWAAWRVT